MPLGDLDLGLGFENHTRFPSRGDILLYPGGFSETEILFAYGSASIASKMGELAGNHFLTVVEGQDDLPEFGRTCCGRGRRRSFLRRDEVECWWQLCRRFCAG